MQHELEEAERAEQEAAAAASRGQEAVNRAKRTRESVAVPTPPPRAREQGVNSRSKRPGDDAFLKGSVVCMASSPREEFSDETRGSSSSG